MNHFKELKKGNLVLVRFNNKEVEGEVTDLMKVDKNIGVATSVQEYYFNVKDVFPIPLSDSQLHKFGFHRTIQPDGSVIYNNFETFQIHLSKENDFSTITLVYKEDIRINPAIHGIHQLQNLYADMTKMHLELVAHH